MVQSPYTTIPCHSARSCYLHVIPNVAERSEESKDPCSQDQVRGCRADALDSSTALRALGMTPSGALGMTEMRAPASWRLESPWPNEALVHNAIALAPKIHHLNRTDDPIP